MVALKGPRKDALSGEANALCVILHGYGADGNDLIGLAQPLAEYLPDVTFVAPNAPDECTNNPMGYQWFPIPWLDGSSDEEAEAGIETASEILNDYLDETMAAEGVGPERTVLVGFSQGTMMSLEVGLRREAQLAGIVGFSGRLVRAEALADEIKSRPPVLLVHGDLDDVVPPSSMPEAADLLGKMSVPTYTHVSAGTAHGIAPDGLSLALSFIRDMLGVDAEEQEPEGDEGDDVSINFVEDRSGE